MNRVVSALGSATNGRKTLIGWIARAVLTYGVTAGWWTAEAIAPWIPIAEALIGVGLIHKADKAINGKKSNGGVGAGP